MPELPEVETIVRQLNKKVVGLKITDAWTDWPKTIKTHNLPRFVKEIKGRKILRARRRAKYIILELSGNTGKNGDKTEKILAIHQKISGHLLYGKWKIKKGKIESVVNGSVKKDKFNGYIRFILYFSNSWMLGLSDPRRFGKVYLVGKNETDKVGDMKKFGPEPLDPKFTFEKFKAIVENKKGKIKQILMDQFFIAGIGNIYSDEILWYAGINPERRIEKLDNDSLKKIYKYIKFVLKKAIKVKGDSQRDYRTLEGKVGGYQNMQKAYKLTGQKCQKKDGGVIERIKVNGRSAHFCPIHQK